MQIVILFAAAITNAGPHRPSGALNTDAVFNLKTFDFLQFTHLAKLQFMRPQRADSQIYSNLNRYICTLLYISSFIHLNNISENIQK